LQDELCPARHLFVREDVGAHGEYLLIEWHLRYLAQPGPMGRLFIGPQGGIPRRRNFNRIWKQAVKRAGIPSDVDLPRLRSSGVDNHDQIRRRSLGRHGVALAKVRGRFGPCGVPPRWDGRAQHGVPDEPPVDHIQMPADRPTAANPYSTGTLCYRVLVHSITQY
jgi:hypothetical protein